MDRLAKLAARIEQRTGGGQFRAFVDSAPVLERAIAEKAGLGWIGKHSNLLNRTAGSWFFLGELYTDLPLPVDRAVAEHCGDCVSCIECCPTRHTENGTKNRYTQTKTGRDYRRMRATTLLICP